MSRYSQQTLVALKGGAHELAGVSLLVDEGSSHATDDLKEEQRDLRQSATSVQDVYDTLKKSFATVEIVKVKDIDVNDDPEAYFLSILAINSTLYASYRTTLSSWNTKVVQVSDQFEILTQTAKYIPNTEDARVIEVNGVGWLIDNHVLQPRAMTTLDGLRRVVLNTSELGPEFDRGKIGHHLSTNQDCSSCILSCRFVCWSVICRVAHSVGHTAIKKRQAQSEYQRTCTRC